MRMQWNNKYIKWGFTAFCVICGSIFFYYLLFHTSDIRLFVSNLTDILMPIIIGVVFAYLMTPILNWFENRALFPLCEKLKMKDNMKNRRLVRAIGILLNISKQSKHSFADCGRQPTQSKLKFPFFIKRKID